MNDPWDVADETPLVTFETADRTSRSDDVVIGYSSFEWKQDPLIRTEDGSVVRITEAVFRF